MSIEIFIQLAVFAFFAGLIDASVGGGGLIQIPALMNALPHQATATIFGTNKLVSAFGTASAIRTYLSRVSLNWHFIVPIFIFAFIFSFVGAMVVSYIPKPIMQPVVFVLLILIAIYTFIKKDFGSLHNPTVITQKQRLLAILFGALIGFYDGVFGPGTGSFFIFVFIKFFAFDFLHASTASKVVNLGTNIAALFYFAPTGHILFTLAAFMIIFNILGSMTGAFIALKYGSRLIRILFLILLVILIGRMGFNIYQSIA